MPMNVRKFVELILKVTSEGQNNTQCGILPFKKLLASDLGHYKLLQRCALIIFSIMERRGPN